MRAKTRTFPNLHRQTLAVLGLSFILVSGFWCDPVQAAVSGEPGLVGRVIVVDAGHGGPDGGATSANGVKEKDITLAVAHKLALYLRESGAVVYLTRTVDTDLATDRDRAQRRRHQGDLRNRTRFVRGKHPDAFISIHCNAVPSPAWHGAQMIYMKGNDEAKDLAETMQQNFRDHLLPTNRAPDDMSTLYLLKRIKGPAVLAEIGFLSNPNEAAYLINPKYQNQVAFSMHTAILQYFANQENEPVEPDGAKSRDGSPPPKEDRQAPSQSNASEGQD